MKRKPSALHSLLFLLVSPVLLIVVSAVVKTTTFGGMLEAGVVASGLTFLLTLLFLRWDRRALRDVGLGWARASVPRWVFGFLLGLVIVAVQEVTISAGRHTHWARSVVQPTFGTVLLALGAYLMLALREELAFRGYPLRTLESGFGMGLALLVTVVFFTLEHSAGGWTWSQALLGPPAGALLFGMAALATRGLAVPLGIHAAFNFGQWMMGQKEVAGVWRLVIDAGFDRQAERLGYAGYLLGMLVAALGFWLWWWRRLEADPLRG